MEFLRRSLPSRIRQALEELPESLDGTYERNLEDINEANSEFAHRIFQCVAVASRPLRVEELSEFLAFDFNAGATPTFRPGWRPVDPLDALLSTCSSLLAIVKVKGSEVIQFSHFSVKEFLTSTRLTEARDPIPRYYVSMAPAHTLVAQACLGILLHLDVDITDDGLKDFHLAKYAAEHWVDHARFETMSEKVQDGVERLFDPRTRHLAVLVRIFDPRPSRTRRRKSTNPSQLRGSSLHYAACFGIHELIEFLVTECSQDVNAQDDEKWTPLHLASQGGHGGFARVLFEHGAKVDVGDKYKWTPLHLASKGGHLDTSQMLIDLGADVNGMNKYKSTPLHLACQGGNVAFARVLIEYGAKVNARDSDGSTPLHLVSSPRPEVETVNKKRCIDLAANWNAGDFAQLEPQVFTSKEELGARTCRICSGSHRAWRGCECPEQRRDSLTSRGEDRTGKIRSDAHQAWRGCEFTVQIQVGSLAYRVDERTCRIRSGAHRA